MALSFVSFSSLITAWLRVLIHSSHKLQLRSKLGLFFKINKVLGGSKNTFDVFSGGAKEASNITIGQLVFAKPTLEVPQKFWHQFGVLRIPNRRKSKLDSFNLKD